MQRLPAPPKIGLRLSVVLVVVALFAVPLWYAKHQADTAYEQHEAAAKEVRARVLRDSKAGSQDWLAAGPEKWISDTESLRLLHVNSSVLGFYGAECLLYLNTEQHTSQLTCSR